MAFDLSTARPVEAADETPRKGKFDLSTARPVEDVPQGDSLAQDTVDVVAEAAAGANSTMMAIPDGAIDAVNLIIGGVKGLGRLASDGITAVNGNTPNMEASLREAVADTQARPIPNVSDVIENVSGFRPGDGGYMEPGMARDAVRAGGQVLIPGAMALTPVAGRNLANPLEAAIEYAGFGSAPSTVTANTIASTIDNSPPIRATGPDPSLPNNFPVAVVNDAAPPATIPGGRIGVGNRAARKVAIENAAKRQEGSRAAAGYKLGNDGSVVKDAAQKKALGAGIDKGIVAQIAQSSPADKRQIGKMTHIVKRGIDNKTIGDFNLPRTVLGDSLYGRWQAVRYVNKKAGEDVGAAVESLKSSPIDGAAFNAGPVRDFAVSLKALGVKISRNGKINFRGSDFEGTPGAQQVIKDTFKRIYDTDVNTLHDAHRLKKFIDNMVNEYGKNAKGLAGDAENVVKELRHNTNNYIREFGPEEYARANDVYSETIEALNNTNRLIGKNNNPSPSHLARTARKALSNYGTGDQVLENLRELDVLAKKYGSQFDDDLQTQISVVQSIEKMFPSAKPANSFGGNIDSSLDYAKKAAEQSTGTTVVDLGLMGLKKAFGKTEDVRQAEMLEAIEELIASGRK